MPFPLCLGLPIGKNDLTLRGDIATSWPDSLYTRLNADWIILKYDQRVQGLFFKLKGEKDGLFKCPHTRGRGLSGTE